RDIEVTFGLGPRHRVGSAVETPARHAQAPAVVRAAPLAGGFLVLVEDEAVGTEDIFPGVALPFEPPYPNERIRLLRVRGPPAEERAAARFGDRLRDRRAAGGRPVRRRASHRTDRGGEERCGKDRYPSFHNR